MVAWWCVDPSGGEGHDRQPGAQSGMVAEMEQGTPGPLGKAQALVVIGPTSVLSGLAVQRLLDLSASRAALRAVSSSVV